MNFQGGVFIYYICKKFLRVMIIKRSDNVNAAIINAISCAVVFVAATLIIIGGIIYYNKNGDFLSSPDTTVIGGAAAVLFASSIIYTPFSYGISYFFLRSKSGGARFLDIFYLFKNPRTLLIAIICDTLRRLIITLIRTLILLGGALIELVMLLSGLDGSLLIIIHVTTWSGILVLMFLVKIRFILCKYTLICYPKSSIPFVFKRGLLAIKGKGALVIRFYIKYLAVYIFSFVTLGFTRTRLANKHRDSFCTYAVRLVSNC